MLYYIHIFTTIIKHLPLIFIYLLLLLLQLRPLLKVIESAGPSTFMLTTVKSRAKRSGSISFKRDSKKPPNDPESPAYVLEDRDTRRGTLRGP